MFLGLVGELGWIGTRFESQLCFQCLGDVSLDSWACLEVRIFVPMRLTVSEECGSLG